MTACVRTYCINRLKMTKTRDLSRTTSHMELTIMQAGKNFKNNRLQRIFERSKSIPKNFVRHMNN